MRAPGARGHLPLPTASTEPRACLLTNLLPTQMLFSRTSVSYFSNTKHEQVSYSRTHHFPLPCPSTMSCFFPVISKSAGMLEVPILSDCYLTPLMHPFTLPLCRSFPSPAGLFCPTAVSLYHLVFEKVWEKTERCQLLLIFGDCYPATRTFESQNLFTYVTN